MRTNVVLDDNLMQTALELSGYKTKREALEEGLKLLIQLNRQKEIRGARGKLRWTADLDEARQDK